MELKKLSPAVVLVLCMLMSCNRKQTDNASAQGAQQGSAAQSAQAVPPTKQQTGVNEATPVSAVTAPETTPTPSPPPPPPKPVVIPAGTFLTVRLQQSLSSKTNEQGDPFNATLAAPLTVNGKPVVLAGSMVSGTVTEAHKAGRFKGGATLDIVLNSLTVGGRVYQISTTSMAQTSKGKGKRTAAMTGGGAGGGALIGGLTGGGKGAAIGALVGAGAGVIGAGFTGNRDIEMLAESAVSFQMTNSLKLPPSAATPDANLQSEDSQQ